MKYIRTKDNKIIKIHSRQEFEETHPEFIDNDNFNYDKWFTLVTQDIDILKQADTIKELCDVFVWQEMVFDRIENNCLIESSYEELETPIDTEMIKEGIYGAIWTDKGLIYVAKMNDKGELELL